MRGADDAYLEISSRILELISNTCIRCTITCTYLMNKKAFNESCIGGSWCRVFPFSTGPRTYVLAPTETSKCETRNQFQIIKLSFINKFMVITEIGNGRLHISKLWIKFSFSHAEQISINSRHNFDCELSPSLFLII